MFLTLRLERAGRRGFAWGTRLSGGEKGPTKVRRMPDSYPTVLECLKRAGRGDADMGKFCACRRADLRCPRPHSLPLRQPVACFLSVERQGGEKLGSAPNLHAAIPVIASPVAAVVQGSDGPIRALQCHARVQSWQITTLAWPQHRAAYF